MFHLEIVNLTAAEIDGELLTKAAGKVFSANCQWQSPPASQARALRAGASGGRRSTSGGKKLALKGDFEISLAIIGEAKMRKLNKFWRGKNRVTDVLSFSFGDGGKKKMDFISAPSEAGFLGEIFICLPYAKKEAKRQNISFEKELETLLVHGILHLLDYDHERSKKEEKEFFDLQDKILR